MNAKIKQCLQQAYQKRAKNFLANYDDAQHTILNFILLTSPFLLHL
jgi:hypothetical protein